MLNTVVSVTQISYFDSSRSLPFIHSGQEYGRTKQFRDPAHKTPVAEDKVPNKSLILLRVIRMAIHLTIPFPSMTLT